MSQQSSTTPAPETKSLSDKEQSSRRELRLAMCAVVSVIGVIPTGWQELYDGGEDEALKW